MCLVLGSRIKFNVLKFLVFFNCTCYIIFFKYTFTVCNACNNYSETLQCQKKKWEEYDLYTRQNYNINFSTYSERVVGFKTWKESFLGLNYWSTYFIFSLMQSKYLFALCKEMGRELVVRKHILQNVGEISKIILKTTRRDSNLKNENNFIFIVLFLIIPWKLWQSLKITACRNTFNYSYSVSK